MKLKTLNSLRLCGCLLFLSYCASAEPRRAWVKQAPAEGRVITALKSDGIGGFYLVGYQSQVNNQAEYFAQRYSGSGDLLWQKNYGAGNGTNNIPRGAAVGANGDLFVTGTSKTVAYTPDGAEKWVAPYAGRALTSTGTNVFVTGYLDGYLSTACLSSNEGTNRWDKTFRFMEPPPDVYAPDYSAAIESGPDGSVYVAGSSAILYFGHINNHSLFSSKGETVLKYSTTGTLLESYVRQGLDTDGDQFNIFEFHIENTPNGLVVTSHYDYGYYYSIFDSNLSIQKKYFIKANYRLNSPPVFYMGSIYTAASALNRDIFEVYSTVSQLNNSLELKFGVEVFYQYHPEDEWVEMVSGLNTRPFLLGNRIALRPYSDMVFYIVDQDGQVVWNDHYNASSDSSDTSAAADTDLPGNVYVAGYSSTPSGGQKLVLLKYTQTAVNKQANGNMLLQFPGEPGKQLKVEATPTLTVPDWTQIALGQVPTNGLFQVEDTNANLYPSRFYRAVTTP